MRIQATLVENSNHLPYTMRSPYGGDYRGDTFNIFLKCNSKEIQNAIDLIKRDVCYSISEKLWFSEFENGFIEIGHLPSCDENATRFHLVSKGEIEKSFSRKELYWACMKIQKMNNCRNCEAHRSIGACAMFTHSTQHIPPLKDKKTLARELQSMSRFKYHVQFIPAGVMGAFGNVPSVYHLLRENWDERIKSKKEAPKKIRESMVARRICEKLCMYTAVCQMYSSPYGAVRCQKGENRTWNTYDHDLYGHGPFTEEVVRKAYSNFFNNLDKKRSVEEITFIALNGGLQTHILGFQLSLRKMSPQLDKVQFKTRYGQIMETTYEDAVKLIKLPYRSGGTFISTGYQTPEKPMDADKLLLYMGICQVDKYEIHTGGGWGSTRKEIGSVQYNPTYDKSFNIRLYPSWWYGRSVDNFQDIVNLVGYWNPVSQAVLSGQTSLLTRAAEVAAEMETMKGTPLSQLRKKK